MQFLHTTLSSLECCDESVALLHLPRHPFPKKTQNILITSSGAWKLAGFGFAVSTDHTTADSANLQAFHYAEYDVEDSLLPLQPSLNYTAPELVRSKSASAGCPSDIFSFGCLAYHLIARKSLFDCHNNVKMYMNTLTYLSSDTFSCIPSELVPDLQRILSVNESSRPTAIDFTGSPFFRNDTRLRALRFLDHMLERDNMQKSEFLKALSDMWKDFDSRVLRYKVLPPLCAELRNLVMQPMILPMVLTIAEAQEKNDFELSTLPALVPVLSTAVGETLLLLVKHAELIINKTSQEHLISHVLPMIVRAYDDSDARIQEEVLRKSAFLSKQLDVQLVKQAILPRVHGLALKTTVAVVRVNALLCLGDLVPTLDKHAILEILQTIHHCTAVDRSAPTLMCTLGVANSILKQYGLEFTAELVLPLITPLLTAQQLNVQQFAKYMLFVKDILRKIEEKRGVSVTDSGIPEVKPSSHANGLQPQNLGRPTGNATSTTKKTPAWDEDWGPTAKQSAPSVPNSVNSITSSTQPVEIESVFATSSQPPQSLLVPMVSNHQPASSCPPVDIEWPPCQSFGATPQIGDSEKQLNIGEMSNSNFDDIDPFANWPPPPSGSASGIGASNNGITGSSITKYVSGSISNTSNSMNFRSNNRTSWAFDALSSVEPMRQNLGNSVATGSLGSHNSQNSLGFLKQNQGIALSNTCTEKKATDIGSIFTSSKNDQTAPRLAPPPSTAVGKGRGRGRGVAAASQYSQVKPLSEQPPLLDLL